MDVHHNAKQACNIYNNGPSHMPPLVNGLCPIA